ncbi:MAG: AAA family ATPase [Chloroflexi bacterium]|nr:AAA family ATPase [Chloroflexota bacterium]
MAEEHALTLRVAEALPKDVGRGIARLDPADIERLAAAIGDVVEIRGKRRTVARLMPAYAAERGKGLIQIDGIIRENTQAGLDDRVQVARVAHQPARSLTLAPTGPAQQALRSQDTSYLGRLLEGVPLLTGDRVRINLFGTRPVDFVVSETTPKDVVLVNGQTAIRIKGEVASERRGPAISYEDIGGLGKEIARIREMIELPLRYPEVFERLGIDPPKGVLLYGPPGCGKTLIARSVAYETAAYFIHVAGPEVIHKFYGESLPGSELVLVLKAGRLERKPIADVVAEQDDSLQVPCFGPDGRVRFGRVTGFYEHRLHGKLLRVRTASGREIRVTEGHSLFTVDSEGIRALPTPELVANESFIAVPGRLPLPDSSLDELDLLYLLRNDESLVARGPAVEQLVRRAIGILGRERCAKLLGVRVKYTYDLVSKRVAIRLPRLLRLAEAAGIPVDPEALTLSTLKRRSGIPTRIPLTTDLCTFFGLWLAEGSFSKGRGVRISVSRDEGDAVAALCTRLFGSVTVYRPANRRATDVHVSSMALVKAMQALGFVSGARRKRVPPFAFSLSRVNLAALIRGYYSGDGSVSRTTPAPQVEVSTASPALADDVCHLLLFFGIVAKVYDRPSEGAKRICFADAKNLERFLEIGFLDEGKNALIRRYLEKCPVPRRDRLPLAAVRDLPGSSVSAWRGLSAIGVAATARRLGTLPAELDGDLYWDKVVAIEELPDQPEHVYDIAVEPGENFVAGFGGIFAHNSEAHLRSIFQDAEQHAPSIVFLDEIDAIAPKREAVQGEVEKRVVAQLLALMDGLKSRGQVIVIGATNIPGSIDPALRRPGRFDREIVISVPDRTGRLEILQIHTRGMPLAQNVDLDRLAAITHGFVGADLAALCREAAMACLRRALPAFDFARSELPLEDLLRLEVTMDHFLEALNEIEPSAIREVFTEVADVKWDQVGGLDEVKRVLREAVEWPLKYGDRFAYARTSPPKGVLLTGAPGTGKTLAAKAVASESGVNFISIKGPALLSKWVGESEKGVREVFKKARQTAPCIVFFDEIDALVPLRGTGGAESHVSERVVSQFLTELDGIEELRGVVVLAATNRPDILDPALLRPGRFDVTVELPLPDRAARRAILEVHTRGRHLSGDVDLDELAEQAEGLVGADLEGLARRAAMLAIRESVEREPGAQFTPFGVERRHFAEALAAILGTQTSTAFDTAGAM